MSRSRRRYEPTTLSHSSEERKDRVEEVVRPRSPPCPPSLLPYSRAHPTPLTPRYPQPVLWFSHPWILVQEGPDPPAPILLLLPQPLSRSLPSHRRSSKTHALYTVPKLPVPSFSPSVYELAGSEEGVEEEEAAMVSIRRKGERGGGSRWTLRAKEDRVALKGSREGAER